MRYVDNRLFFAQVEAVLAEGGEVQIRMRGHSMRPWLRDGRDIAVIAPCDGEQAVRGDVVLFRYRGGHVLHRVVSRDGDRLLLAGDGNYRLREQCRAEDVCGRLVRIIRPSGRIVACDSRRWRWQSRCWTAMPALARRLLLGVLWRIGCK